MRRWRATIFLARGSGSKVYQSVCSKTYKPSDVRDIIGRVRAEEQAAGLPPRKLSPVSRYILEEQISDYLANTADETTILEEIVIEDNKVYVRKIS